MHTRTLTRRCQSFRVDASDEGVVQHLVLIWQVVQDASQLINTSSRKAKSPQNVVCNFARFLTQRGCVASYVSLARRTKKPSSQEDRYKLARFGAHLVPIGAPIACRKRLSPNVTNILSSKKPSHFLIMGRSQMTCAPPLSFPDLRTSSGCTWEAGSHSGSAFSLTLIN